MGIRMWPKPPFFCQGTKSDSQQTKGQRRKAIETWGVIYIWVATRNAKQCVLYYICRYIRSIKPNQIKSSESFIPFFVVIS